MKKFILLALLICTGLLAMNPAVNAAGRDYIYIVGSSTVYPFATVAAEEFGRSSGFKTPKIESTGSGGGFKLFAAGIGIDTPDITNASRRIKKSEFERCLKNGIKGVVEIKIGYDGIVIANAKEAPRLRLTRRALFLALAQNVPNPDGREHLVSNPYRTWKEIDPRLPAFRIRVLGPPPTSGTRDAFVELAMAAGAQTFPWLKALRERDKRKFKEIAHTLREDGAYIEAGENDNLIVQKLAADHTALGIFGFSYLDQNDDRIQGSIIDGIEPSFENISQSRYPISRPLFIYVKKAHVGTIPGLKEYLEEFLSEKACGEEGYLADRGLIPMPAPERSRYRTTATKLEPVLSKKDF
ncbi:MAG: PstS family phosphate ABC transporter substrate-binding protein [Deltaproteobacteria bacterium]|nr:PstS family phosphate ABC transporter substrate-binding protein [Deltaproteobacteria bacterium]